MLHRFVRLTVIPIVALVLVKSFSRGEDIPDPITRIECDTDFAFRLYRTLAEDRKHFVLSPFSVSAALGMVSGGAEGRTLEELRAVRGSDMEDAKYHAAFATLRKSMQAVKYDDRVTLAMDNALFLQDGREIQPAFQTLLETTYGCQLFRVDFEHQPLHTLNQLNQFVRVGTNGRGAPIQDTEIPIQTLLVLANTFYFKASWESPFGRADTTLRPFYPEPDRGIQVHTMYQKHTFPVAADEEAIILGLPYKHSRFIMYIVLPRPGRTLEEIEKGLDAKKWTAWRESTVKHELELYLPRFAFASRYELSPAIATMGAPSAFNRDQADFGGISELKPLAIDLLIHSVGVEVDESGTVAHAHTEVGGGFGEPEPLPLPSIVNVDRPFLFIITDLRHRSILFMGRVQNPAPAGP